MGLGNDSQAGLPLVQAWKLFVIFKPDLKSEHGPFLILAALQLKVQLKQLANASASVLIQKVQYLVPICNGFLSSNSFYTSLMFSFQIRSRNHSFGKYFKLLKNCNAFIMSNCWFNILYYCYSP
ncbi:hypothetical protein TorRG33x02_275700 [Trema orientale]|uniref:Uncharacterized protein n=1 Tax=Trema orientale TaxID=63057 RepID=A0A2P5CRM6_TREOI|nr:hypothetical protein TorRG33x02_275700 [Trema orientale]